MQFNHSSHFEWNKFFQQAKHADPARIGIALVIIYVCYALRAVRWAIFLRPTKPVSSWSLMGTQFIGFTAVALFGRLGELVRPYLVARRIQLPLSSQLAVYAVERMFDLASVALIFSVTLMVSPFMNALPHHELFHSIGYAAMAIAVTIGVSAFLLRVSGKQIANASRRLFRVVSKNLGDSVAVKVLSFSDGLKIITSSGDLLAALAVSLIMWGLIAWSYVEVTHSFVQDPVLASLPFSHCMLLMAASMVGSIVQLPFVGGGSQMATATAMRMLFNVAIEPAVGCGILLWLVTFASVVPAGLIWARFEHVSLKKAAVDSELDQNSTFRG